VAGKTRSGQAKDLGWPNGINLTFPSVEKEVNMGGGKLKTSPRTEKKKWSRASKSVTTGQPFIGRGGEESAGSSSGDKGRMRSGGIKITRANWVRGTGGIQTHIVNLASKYERKFLWRRIP